MGKSLLCATVTAATTAELRRLRDERGGADLVELRLDSVEDPDVAGALSGRKSPVIVTCRPAWEGGAFRGSEEERKQLLADALAQGAEYVDVEWRARFDDLVGGPHAGRVVLSMHDFEGVPGDLPSRLRAMRSTGAGVVKIAVTANRLADCVTLLDLSRAQPPEPSRAPDRWPASGGLVLLAMGDYGLATRILARRFASAWTYAGAIRSVGQITVETMMNMYRYPAINQATQVYGIVGGSIRHSVSPAMHNSAFRAAKLDAVYVPFPAVSADDFVAFGKAIRIAGASVTIPHKVALFDRVDEVYPGARRIGAINTIREDRGRWVGDNTDAGGFLEPLRGRVALPGLRAAVLGAGGAARAVVDALAASRCSVRIHARRLEQAEQVAALTSADVGPWPPLPGSWDLLVNCTPIGQGGGEETPVPIERLTGSYVYDLVYNPPATRLLRDAAAAGCQTISGVDMLVAQAQEQFRWWTGARAPAGVMRAAALERLAELTGEAQGAVAAGVPPQPAREAPSPWRNR